MQRFLPVALALAFATFSCLLGGSNAQNGTEVIITLFATDLNGCDDLSACDTVVTIRCSSSTSAWKECGKTSELGDDNFPLWPERFRFNYVQEENQEWEFKVDDIDVLFDDHIATTTVTMKKFMQEAEITGLLRLTLGTRGFLYIHKRVF